jgi:hypothetical protein
LLYAAESEASSLVLAPRGVFLPFTSPLLLLLTSMRQRAMEATDSLLLA